MSDRLPDLSFWGLFLGGFCATAILTPWVMRLARRVGAVDRGGYRRVHEEARPLLGGLGIAAPVIGLCALSCLAGSWIVRNWEWVARVWPQGFSSIFEFAGLRREFAVLALGGLAIVALGLADDIRGMRARYKLAGQILVASLACAGGYTVRQLELPWIGTVSFGPVSGGLITILWIVGLINAFNLIDGIDGLAAGSSLIVSAGLAILAARSGATTVAVVCAAMAGSSLAFLAYNFNPARVFLGDTGSMFLGFILAGATLMGAYKSQTAVMVLAPLLALGFPIFETFVSMLRRLIRGKPIFAADQHHTHHRLLNKGYSQRQTALLLCGVTFVCTAAGVLSQVIPQHSKGSWIPIGLYGVTIAWIAWLAGYLRPVTLRSISERRQRNAVLLAFSRYAAFSLNSDLKRTTVEEILNVGRKDLGLRFLEVWQEDASKAIVSSGTASKEEQSTFPFRLIEKIRIKSAEGKGIMVLYQFDHDPDSYEQQDVKACLAGLFEQVRVSRLDVKDSEQDKTSQFKVVQIE